MLLLVPALLAPVAAYLISFAMTPKYTSRALLVVEGQVVPAGYIKPLITDYVSDRMTVLQQQVLTRDRLGALVSRLGLAKNGQSADAVINEIRNNVSIAPADPNAPVS